MRDRRLLHYFPLMITERYLERILDSVDGEVDDVGPLPRQVVTRTDGFFGGLNHLTLSNKLIRCQVAERAMRAPLIIVEPPGFDHVLSLGERAELGHVETFISQSAVKRLNESVLHRFAGPNEVEFILRRYAEALSARYWNFVS